MTKTRRIFYGIADNVIAILFLWCLVLAIWNGVVSSKEMSLAEFVNLGLRSTWIILGSGVFLSFSAIFSPKRKPGNLGPIIVPFFILSLWAGVNHLLFFWNVKACVAITGGSWFGLGLISYPLAYIDSRRRPIREVGRDDSAPPA